MALKRVRNGRIVQGRVFRNDVRSGKKVRMAARRAVPGDKNGVGAAVHLSTCPIRIIKDAPREQHLWPPRP